MEPNLNLGVETAQKQKQASQGLLTGQDVRTGDYLGKLGQYVASQPSSQVMADRIGQELGLPQLRETSGALTETVRNLPSTYSKAMTGFDVNANQLARVVGTKQAELAPLAQRATEQTQNAEARLGERMGYAQKDFERGLIPLSAEQNFLAERNARETTLYSQDNQNELNAIIDKIKNGIQISEAEKQRAHELAMQEKAFENQKKLNQQQADLSPAQSNTQVIEVNGQKKLIDTATGKVLSTYGTASSGSGAPKPTLNVPRATLSSQWVI